MADESGFSFITVGAAEEEDVVIQAGIVEDAVAEPQVEPVQPEEAADFEDAVEIMDTESEFKPAPEPEPEPAPEPAPAPKQGKQAKQAKLEAAFGSKAPAPAPQKVVPSKKPADDFEQTTTLADLEANEPMPAVRMAMIGVALIALVAFLVYFNFFM